MIGPTFPYPNFGAAPAPSQSNGVDYNTDRTPYYMQYNFNIQREVAPATILQVGYVGSRGVNLSTRPTAIRPSQQSDRMEIRFLER